MPKQKPSSLGAEWLSSGAAAETLGIIPRTLYRLIDEGELPAYRVGRVIRLRAADIEEFLDRHRIQPGELRHLYQQGDEDVIDEE